MNIVNGMFGDQVFRDAYNFEIFSDKYTINYIYYITIM